MENKTILKQYYIKIQVIRQLTKTWHGYKTHCHWGAHLVIRHLRTTTYTEMQILLSGWARMTKNTWFLTDIDHDYLG